MFGEKQAQATIQVCAVFTDKKLTSWYGNNGFCNNKNLEWGSPNLNQVSGRRVGDSAVITIRINSRATALTAPTNLINTHVVEPRG